MLKRFTVRNYKNFRNEITIDFGFKALTGMITQG